MKGQSNIVEQILKRLPALPALSSPQATARRLGIPPAQIDRMIRAGAIQAIALGQSRFVPARWLARRVNADLLRAWARGASKVETA